MRLVDVDALRRALARAFCVGRFPEGPLPEDIRHVEVHFDEYRELTAILRDLLTVQNL